MAFAKRLVTIGNQVIVGSRSKEKISEVIKDNKIMSGYPVDVSDQDGVQRFYNQVIAEFKNIDIVIAPMSINGTSFSKHSF
ncbi:SDR family NAD(P)-dependent oxidoreductase [Liquorilactobacillus mali]|uniref:SDR family NAD(P)-dependent oxidoreductase n=1 Tax=Liquorilactobacillus mali TaxID=1618 RepID=UPI002954A900|nr:SDR family NAD(P)-dependent oxidoreductase [Liquorilactobacillus mali]